MILFLLFSSVVLFSCKRQKLSLLLTLFCFILKSPCPEYILNHAGDEFAYIDSFTSRSHQISDRIFLILNQVIYQVSGALWVNWLLFYLSFSVLILYGYFSLRSYFSVFPASIPFFTIALSPLVLAGQMRQGFVYLLIPVFVSYLDLFLSSYKIKRIHVFYIISLFAIFACIHLASTVILVSFSALGVIFLRIKSSSSFSAYFLTFKVYPLTSIRRLLLHFRLQPPSGRIRLIPIILAFCFLFIAYFFLIGRFNDFVTSIGAYNLWLLSSESAEAGQDLISHTTILKKMLVISATMLLPSFSIARSNANRQLIPYTANIFFIFSFLTLLCFSFSNLYIPSSSLIRVLSICEIAVISSVMPLLSGYAIIFLLIVISVSSFSATLYSPYTIYWPTYPFLSYCSYL